MSNRTDHGTDAGYTLLEVMISMLILAIAFLALIAVQLGALNGYISARDNTEATELARRTAELMKVEALQWQSGTYDTGTPVYSNAESPFDVANPVATLGTTWTPLVNTPVDVGFARSGVTSGQLGGKFCLYAKGGYMAEGMNNAAKQVLIAVVYPGPNANLLQCSTITDTMLEGTGSVGLAPALELQGYRVVYNATVVVRG